MLARAFRLAENLAILCLLTGSALAMHMAAARVRHQRLRGYALDEPTGE